MKTKTNIKKLETAKSSREYRISQKNFNCYCYICNRRAGRFGEYCGPLSYKKNRSWKQYRKTQHKTNRMKRKQN